MNWRAEQALIVQDVMYFSGFGQVSEEQSGIFPIIAAYDLSARELLWHIEQKPLAPMVSDSKRLFVLTDNRIVAFSITDGSILWQTHLAPGDDYSFGELLFGDGRLFFSHYSELYALNAYTGAIIWIVHLDAEMDGFKPVAGPLHWTEHRVMAYDHSTLYVRVSPDVQRVTSRFHFALIALDAKNGRELWRFPFDTPTTQGDAPPGGASRLAFDEQAVYFCAFGGISYALDRDTGNVLWKRQIYFDYPVYDDKQIIAISDYQTVGALDAQTGGLRWTFPFIDSGIGSLSPFVLSGDYLVFYSSGDGWGQLSVLSLKSGKAVFVLHQNFPCDCEMLFPIEFVMHGEHLYLVTLNCIHSFQVSW